jgi:outer membrane protein assembly factor BamA
MGSWAVPARAGIDLDFRGNEHLGDRKLRRLLPQPPKDADAAAARDWMEGIRRSIERLYEDEGFFEAAVDADFSGSDGDWEVTLTVREGPRYRVDTVAVLAQEGEAPHVGAGALPLEAGEPFSRELLAESQRELLESVGDGGFMRSRVDERIDVDTSAKTVSVEFLVRAGRSVTFDTLIIRNRREAPWDSLEGITRNHILRRLLPYGPGDTVRFRENDRYIDKLQATGAFQYLEVQDTLLPDGRSALVLLAVEDRPGRIRGSLFYDTQYRFGATSEVRHDNLFGTLNEAAIGFTLAQEKQALHARYGSALTFGTLLRFDDEVEANWYQSDPIHDVLETPPFHGDFELSNSARFSRGLRRWLRLVGSFDFLFRSHALDLERRQRGSSLSFSPSAFLTFLDNPLEPMRGVRFAFSAGAGSDFPGLGPSDPTDYFHYWVEGFSAYYYPLLVPELIFAARLDAGRYFGRPDIGVPRFYLGGPRTVRSFAYKSICPLREEVVVEGGTVEFCLEDGIVPANVLGSVELRMQLFAFEGVRDAMPSWLVGLQTVPFADAGKVWDTRGGFDAAGPEGEGLSYGVGLRYPLFAIFNLRLDFAWGRDGAGERNFAWILDLAHAF